MVGEAVLAGAFAVELLFQLLVCIGIIGGGTGVCFVGRLRLLAEEERRASCLIGVAVSA